MAVNIELEPLKRKSFILHPNYPNPFNSTTILIYNLEYNDNVQIKYYNSLGQQIGEYVNEWQIAGNHQYLFDAQNLSSGLYYYRIGTTSNVQTGKVMLLK